MDRSENSENSENSEVFDKELADELYKLLEDLYETGRSDILIGSDIPLNAEVNGVLAIAKSTALENEAKDILKVFTTTPITPIVRQINSISVMERAVLPRIPMSVFNNNIINLWKHAVLLNSIQNDRLRITQTNPVNVKLDGAGSFVISGIENISDGIKEIIQELCGLIKIEGSKNDESGMTIQEITDGDEENNMQIVHVPMADRLLSTNENSVDVFEDIYDTNLLEHVPDFLVESEEEPVIFHNLISGYDLLNNDEALTVTARASNVPAIEYNIKEKKQEKEVKKTSKNQRRKKNKRKQKKK